MRVEKVPLPKVVEIPDNCRYCKYYNAHYCSYHDTTVGTNISRRRRFLMSPSERGWVVLPTGFHPGGCVPPDYCPLRKKLREMADAALHEMLEGRGENDA